MPPGGTSFGKRRAVPSAKRQESRPVPPYLCGDVPAMLLKEHVGEADQPFSQCMPALLHLYHQNLSCKLSVFMRLALLHVRFHGATPKP